MKYLPLTKGQAALVDDADFAYLSRWKWSLNSFGYAVRGFRIAGRQYTQYMHLALMPDYARNRIHVTHLNKNKTDNRRQNLAYKPLKK